MQGDDEFRNAFLSQVHPMASPASATATEVVQTMLNQVARLTPPTLANGLLASLSESSDNGTAETLMERRGTYRPSTRHNSIATLLRRLEWTLVLLDGTAEGSIQGTDISPEYCPSFAKSLIHLWPASLIGSPKQKRESLPIEQMS